MKDSIRRVGMVASVVVGLTMAVGCTKYYKVSDPTTGKSYYTTKVKDLDGGATRLEDTKTKTEVTIQNSQVQEITKDQYEAALYTSPDAKPK